MNEWYFFFLITFLWVIPIMLYFQIYSTWKVISFYIKSKKVKYVKYLMPPVFSTCVHINLNRNIKMNRYEYYKWISMIPPCENMHFYTFLSCLLHISIDLLCVSTNVILVCWTAQLTPSICWPWCLNTGTHCYLHGTVKPPALSLPTRRSATQTFRPCCFASS